MIITIIVIIAIIRRRRVVIILIIKCNPNILLSFTSLASLLPPPSPYPLVALCWFSSLSFYLSSGISRKPTTPTPCSWVRTVCGTTLGTTTCTAWRRTSRTGNWCRWMREAMPFRRKRWTPSPWRYNRFRLHTGLYVEVLTVPEWPYYTPPPLPPLKFLPNVSNIWLKAALSPVCVKMASACMVYRICSWKS